MSDRTLAYSEEPIKHRFLVIYEAAGMSSNFATYLMRSLLSEGCVRYETVEKTSEGMKPRLIEREGPTGLIVTTTAVKLHPENETRLLSLIVTDTQEQTRAVMAALAEERGEATPDLATWHTLQVWLESAEHRVWIPYAKKLAELIPPMAVRLRRDFGALLNLIRAHALLHQATRARDAEGRIVATIEEDYAAVRELVADLVSEGIEATVPATVRETVEAVKWLRETSNGEPVTVAELARELKLDRSAVSRRVRNAKDRGYLRDLEENPRKPSRLIPGDDLPDDLEILPDPEDVRASVKEGASGSARLGGGQEPHSNAGNSGNAYKACNRARVQEALKNPPPSADSQPGEADNPQDDNLEEVRNLFASDAMEEV
jgi:DNA-binding transcriptional ArsR family regulator